MRRVSLLWICLCSLSLDACDLETLPIPARPMLLDSPATLARGETGVSAQGSVHGMTQSDDGAWGTLTLQSRRGFGNGIEASLGATQTYVFGTQRTALAATATSLRLGLRYQFYKEGSKGGTVFAGVGGGLFASTGIATLDAGVVVGREAIFFMARASVVSELGSLCCYGYGGGPFGIAETMLGVRIPETEDRTPGTIFFVAGAELVQVFASVYHLGVAGGSALEIVF